jgi:hypothetical protein
MWLEMDKAKENQSARNLQGKVGVELLIEHSRPEGRNGNKGSKEGGQKTKAKDKIPSESPLGKMLKYWDDSSRTKGKRNKEWLNTVILFGRKN